MKEGLGVADSKHGIGSAWRQVTGGTKLVSIWISEVSAIVMLVVLGPQTGRTFGRTTVGERYGVDMIYRSSAHCEECDHLAVATLMRLLVVGLANEEQWPRIGRRLPTSPRQLRIAEARFDAECGHYGVVERKSAVEIGHADKDV